MRSIEVCSANILKCSVETNTPCGGDTGHGGRTKIIIKDLGGTDIDCSWDANKGKLVIELGGDTECDTIIECLRYAALELRRQQIKNEYAIISKGDDDLFFRKGDEAANAEKQKRKEALITEFSEIIKELKPFVKAHEPDNRWDIFYKDGAFDE